MITVATAIATEDSVKAAEAAAKKEERLARINLAQRCLRDLPVHVRDSLQQPTVPPRVTELLERGDWKKAATALDRAGFTSAASWLRLETPYALDH